MSELLQVQIAVDEEASLRFGKPYEESVERNAYSALADEMIKSRCVKTTIIDPKAKDAPDYVRYGMRRYYRFSVLVGDKPDTQALVDAEKRGFDFALNALRNLLQRPNDYQGEMRAYFLRWLDGVSVDDLAIIAAELRDDQ